MREAQHDGELQCQVTDAANQASLLIKDVFFNDEATLGRMANLRHTLGHIEVSTQSDNFLNAFALLEKAENVLGELGSRYRNGGWWSSTGTHEGSFATASLRIRLSSCWQTFLRFASTILTISMSEQVPRRCPEISPILY